MVDNFLNEKGHRLVCGEFENADDQSINEVIQEYLFDKNMEPIIQKRLNDGQKPIPVNLEDLL